MSIDLDSVQDTETLAAKTYTWDGKPIAPFSFGRQSAFQRINVVRGDDLDSRTEAAVAMVKLCQMKEEDIVMIRGEEAIAGFLMECGKWAEDNGIGLGVTKKPKTDAINELYISILTDIYEAEKVVPDVKPGAGGNA